MELIRILTTLGIALMLAIPSDYLTDNVGAAWRMCRLLKAKLLILAVTAALRQTACYLPLKLENYGTR